MAWRSETQQQGQGVVEGDEMIIVWSLVIVLIAVFLVIATEYVLGGPK